MRRLSFVLPPQMLGHGPPMTVLVFELRTHVFKGLLKQRILYLTDINIKWGTGTQKKKSQSTFLNKK